VYEYWPYWLITREANNVRATASCLCTHAHAHARQVDVQMHNTALHDAACRVELADALLRRGRCLKDEKFARRARPNKNELNGSPCAAFAVWPGKYRRVQSRCRRSSPYVLAWPPWPRAYEQWTMDECTMVVWRSWRAGWMGSLSIRGVWKSLNPSLIPHWDVGSSPQFAQGLFEALNPHLRCPEPRRLRRIRTHFRRSQLPSCLS